MTEDVDEMIIRPQAGPQEKFLACPADVVFYGGAAGGGKTVALLIDVARNCMTFENFNAVIFRRTYPEITNAGGLWDESQKIFPYMGGKGTRGALRWSWPKMRSSVKFSHMQHDSDVYSWQGAQIGVIGFDELTHFSENAFFYMMSRNRSTCGMRPYMRATMNPDPDSWVRNFIAWYIDDRGYAIPERSGVIRYFGRRDGHVVWADTADELKIQGLSPKSFTFIMAKLSDNKILMRGDPDYKANLESQVSYQRERLLDGNWNARPTPGEFFKRANFEIVDAAPSGGITVRYWDRASTRPSAQNQNPDWTRGCRMSKVDGIYYIHHMASTRDTPAGVEKLIRSTADEDPEDMIGLEKDPGQAGVADVDNLIRMLSGFDVRSRPATVSKEIRARPFSAQVEAGNVKLVRGSWNKEYLDELEQFPDPNDVSKDDQVDASSGAFNMLNEMKQGRIRTL